MEYKNLKSDDEHWYELIDLLKNSIELKPVSFILFSFDTKTFADTFSKTLNLNEDETQVIANKLDKYMEEKLSKNKSDIDLRLSKLIGVSNRLQMILNLKSKSNEVNFGIWGLLVYLSLTCFDTLGQNQKFLTFDSWILKFDDPKISELKNVKQNLIRENIALIYNEYEQEYGVKNRFFSFLKSIRSTAEHAELLSCIEPMPAVAREAADKGILEEFKEFWLYSFRNDFTHNSHNFRWDITNNDYSSIIVLHRVKNKRFKLTIKHDILLDKLIECIVLGIKEKYTNLMKEIN